MVALLGPGLLTFLVAAASNGVLVFDDDVERVILDVQNREPTTPRAAVVKRGSFSEDAAGVALVRPPRYGETIWVPESAPVADGVWRARLRVGKRPDSTLLVRAQLAAQPGDDNTTELEGGYGITVDKGAVRLVRWEHRIPRLLGIEEKLARALHPGDLVEIVVVAAGPHLFVDVVDGKTLRRLAHVSAHDRGFSAGSVGWRIARGQDKDTALVFLSMPRERAASREPGISPRDEGAGIERLLVVPGSDVARLPADLSKLVVEQAAQQLGGEAVLVADPVSEERLRRMGVSILRKKTQMPWKYLDASVRARIGKPPTPTATGFRIDESFKDAAMVEAILRAYAERFPALTRLVPIGRSLQGRPLLALMISKNAAVDEDEDAILLDGGHHGGELMSIEFVLDAVQQLLEGYGRDPNMTRFVDRLAIWCVPLVNVDGNSRYIHDTRDSDRKNARDIDENGRIDGWDGVDLYRNYPIRFGGLGEVGSRSWPFHYRYRGPAAGSEPEVQAMVRLADEQRFVASIDYHTNGTAILVPYTDPSMTNPPDNEAWTIAKEMATQLPVQVNGKRYVVLRNLYPVDGTAQDYFRFSHATVALLVEGPTNNPMPYSQRRTPAVVGTRGSWQHLMTRIIDGPSLVIHTRKQDGAPAEATVRIEEMPTKNEERWTTRPRDGRQRRLLSKPGSYTIVVEGVAGSARKTVVVGSRAVEVDLVLQP